jgi:hypothetical protein
MQFNKVEENITLLFCILIQGREKTSPKNFHPLKRKEDKSWMPRGKGKLA